MIHLQISFVKADDDWSNHRIRLSLSNNITLLFLCSIGKLKISFKKKKSYINNYVGIEHLPLTCHIGLSHPLFYLSHSFWFWKCIIY